jgi:hypothetical protein
MAKSAAKQLDSFLAKYTPEIQAFAKDAHTRLRELLPGAVEMVYDNYNALVIGFSPNERPSDAIFSLVMYPRYVCVCFLQGAGLPDPHRLLRGNGKVVRNIRLEDPSDLDKPEIRELIAVALERARVPLDESNRGKLIIRSVSAAQRPRRPGEKAN